MKMRVPALPLIAVDTYFSVWSFDEINTRYPASWTGSQKAMLGFVFVDGEKYRFLGKSSDREIKQVSVDIDAFSTTVIFENELIRLKANFLSPLLIDNLYYLSRPVSYLKLSYESLDGKKHNVSAKISVSEEFVLRKAGVSRALSEKAEIKCGSAVKMGNGEQKILGQSGDHINIDWGYFYLAAKGESKVGSEVFDSLYAVYAEAELKNNALFVFAYDDITSIEYFGQPLSAYWKKDGKDILSLVDEALSDYDVIALRCEKFSKQMTKEATEKGSEKYAELLTLAYRQVMSGHKLVTNENGENLYISMECSSAGMGSTVDVIYPSAPMFLKYNTELLKGMLRPVFYYAESDLWKFDFAPHDLGFYPILNGQTYGNNALDMQMPVEECGNMIILTAAICKTEKSADFAASYIDIIDKWSKYLVKYGKDPENQLCTDDFAGHMAHNVNLSIKAVMGLIGYSEILGMLGDDEKSSEYSRIAKEYAASLMERAKNQDGSYRLAYDRPDTFSLKYNAVWDKLWKTELFTDEFYENEIKRYKKEALPYGVPLDSREKYTKSDWLHWVSCFAKTKEDFEFFTSLMWNAFNTMRKRVPMTDWYYADTAELASEFCPFYNRTVQGGLFCKLLY